MGQWIASSDSRQIITPQQINDRITKLTAVYCQDHKDKHTILNEIKRLQRLVNK